MLKHKLISGVNDGRYWSCCQSIYHPLNQVMICSAVLFDISIFDRRFTMIDHPRSYLSTCLLINTACTFFIGIKYQHLPARCCPWYCSWWDQNVSWLILGIRIHYFITILIFLTEWKIFVYVKSKQIYWGENYLRHTCFKVV